MKTTIISLYGGPGTGKSTSAAFLYFALKSAGCNAELVREYVKDWAWEKRNISTYDQVYLLGKQARRETMLYGKVDWVVTDSPITMNAYYARAYCPPHISQAVEATVRGLCTQAEADGHRHVHVFLRRTKPYLAHGRYQDEAQARDIDVGVKDALLSLGVPFRECGTDTSALGALLDELVTPVQA